MPTLSLRVLMSIIIALVSITSALIAFVPPYLSGVSAVRSSLVDIRRSYVGRTQNQTTDFFKLPFTLLSEYQSLASRDILTFDLTAYSASEKKWLGYMYNFISTHTKLLNNVALLVNDTTNPFGWKLAHADNRFLPITGRKILLLSNGTHTPVHDFNATGGVSDRGVFSSLFPFNWPIIYAWTPYPLIAANPNFDISWVPAAAGYDSAQIQLCAALRNSQGQLLALMRTEILASATGQFLRGLGLRERARGVILDATNGLVLGLSTTEPTVVLNGAAYLNIALPNWVRMQIKTLNNVSDPLLLEVGAAVGVNNILTAPAPFATIIQSKDYGKTFVDVVSVTGHGLNVRVLLAMPEVDFMESVIKARGITMGVLAAVILVMILVALAIGHLITIPVVRLKDRMYLTASLQDNGEQDDSPSIIQEVSEMQQSYILMRGELEKMKSYLPQSVLALLRGGTSDDEEEDEEGEVIRSKESSVSGVSPRNSIGDPLRLSGHGGSSGAYGGSGSQQANNSGSLHASTKRPRSRNPSDSGSSYAANAAPVRLNTDASLQQKRVSILCLNLKSFNAYAAASTTDTIVKMEDEFLQIVMRIVDSHRGVVDFFQGDRVQVSFNAVRPCGAHARKAAGAALAIQKECYASRTVLTATAGISSGSAYVGNIGATGMRRFCILGPVVTQAALLERMTKLYSGVDLLMNGQVLNEVCHDIFCHTIDIVSLPGLPRPTRIAALVAARGSAAESNEWMYELAEGESNDPFLKVNAAFSRIMDGDYDKARSELTDALALSSPIPELLAMEMIPPPKKSSNPDDAPRPCSLSEGILARLLESERSTIPCSSYGEFFDVLASKEMGH